MDVEQKNRFLHVLCEILCCGDDNISEEKNLVKELGADETDVVLIAIMLEREFHIPELDDYEISRVETVGDMWRLVDKALKEKKACQKKKSV